MGTCSHLATLLDADMIGPHRIYPGNTRVQDLPTVLDPASELHGRFLLRYVLARHVGELRNGSSDPQWVTPTPYAPEETVSWLALPAPTEPREYVLMLDPSRLHGLVGPKWVYMGRGIEYILTQGFDAEAIVNLSPGSPIPARWEIEIR
jgi:hypothetical protein